MPESCEKEFGIVAIGGAYLDINSTEFPFDHAGMHIGQEFSGNSYELGPGGSSLNFLKICEKLGLATVFVGKTGRDVLADALCRLISDFGIKTELIADEEVQTNISRNYVNHSGEVIYTTAGSANQS